MKGILEKTSRGWIIKEIIGEGPNVKFIKTYPLHPSDVENLEPCVLGTYGEVYFEEVNEYIDKHINPIEIYAKLTTPMLDRLKEHLNSITPDQFNEEIEKIQSEGFTNGPTIESMKFLDLKKLEKNLDLALEKETEESLNKWIKNKRDVYQLENEEEDTFPEKLNIGLCKFGCLSKKRKIFWEIQLFAFPRSFKDGIQFFNVNINWDRFISEHTPSFEIEITIFNCYNCFKINKYNQ